MEPILNVVLPVFGIMLAGFLAGRFGLLGEASSEALNRFVYFVALPALFFIALSRVPLGEAFNWPFLAAYGGGMLGTFGLSLAVAVFAFPNRLGGLGLHALCTIFANTGYIGIPLSLLVFGEAGTFPAVIATVVNGVVVMSVGVIILEIDQRREASALLLARSVLRGVLKSPLLMAAAVGLLVSALHLPLPAPIATFADTLGAAAGPCALFAMGLFMVGKSFTAGAVEVGWLVTLKLLMQPLLTWWLAYQVLHLEPLWADSALLQSALPTGALMFVLAQRYNVFVQRSTAVIMASTVGSVVTLSVVLNLLEPL